ncbi:cysteine hydrolase family protein [Kineococcus rhizosphaerae]|uniref:Nicotinamidase-related amidase n=1 Tax=Kineococcus rhizosphaerae TaxID=559628 RepID=A0A2T0QY27_9ACTN|nr:isochorismatase family cysteine hydrolase [Kineococcus rhizosphaerae]PRY11096.1 nicotinamidase-related amidase [Kineococcus rhizosphaerae]
MNRDTWTLERDHVDLRRPGVEPRVVTLDAAPQRLTLDLARTAVVVVDLQNDFCHPDGWLASIGVDVSGATAPVEPLRATLPPLRAAGAQVVWLNWGNRPDRANLPPGVRHVYDPDGSSTGIGDELANGSRVLTEGSWSAALVDGLVPEPQDVAVAKFRMSGFFDTELDSVLRRMRVDTLLFAGVNTDQCVLATLSDAACLGYDVVLVEDLCATTSPRFCTDATLYNVRQVFGFTTTSAQLRAALTA